MPHLALHVFGVSACLDHPGRMRGPQAPPVDPGQTKFGRGRLDVPRQDVIVTHGSACPDRLKYEILRPVGLHDFVVPDGAAGFDVNGELLQAIDPLDNAALNAYGVAGIAFGSVPVTAAAPLINRQRVGAYILPTQTDQFTDAESCPDGYINHARVRLRNQLHQLFELLWRYMRFGFAFTALVRRNPDPLDRVLNQQSVLDC